MSSNDVNDLARVLAGHYEVGAQSWTACGCGWTADDPNAFERHLAAAVLASGVVVSARDVKAREAQAVSAAADELARSLSGYTRETPQTQAGRDIIARLRQRADRMKPLVREPATDVQHPESGHQRHVDATKPADPPEVTSPQNGPRRLVAEPHGTGPTNSHLTESGAADALARVLWDRWQNPEPGIPGVLINDDPRTVAQVILASGVVVAADKVRALADEWDKLPCHTGYQVTNQDRDDAHCLHCSSDELRAQLRDRREGEQR